MCKVQICKLYLAIPHSQHKLFYVEFVIIENRGVYTVQHRGVRGNMNLYNGAYAPFKYSLD